MIPKTEECYISVDRVCTLTENKNPCGYWSDLKRILKEEGSQLYDEIVQLKMKSKDGKYYNTDVAIVKQMFRIIQSITSPKAERNIFGETRKNIDKTNLTNQTD